MNVHPTAIVDPSARLDPTVTVGPYAIIEGDVTIGPETVIGPHAFIAQGTRMGAKNAVHIGAVIGYLPQDVAFAGEPSFTTIGDRNTFREYCTIHRGTRPGSQTVIGSDCYFMALSHAGHNCQVGDQATICNGTLLAGYVQVLEGAFVSGNCVVHQYVRIGRLAMVSGGSRIGKDIPPFLIAELDSVVSSVNFIGLRRAGLSPAARAEIKEAYQLLYHAHLNTGQALQAIASRLHSPEAAEFLAFIQASKRGICRHKGLGRLSQPALEGAEASKGVTDLNN